VNGQRKGGALQAMPPPNILRLLGDVLGLDQELGCWIDHEEKDANKIEIPAGVYAKTVACAYSHSNFIRGVRFDCAEALSPYNGG
jgi:hypothetical protein